MTQEQIQEGQLISEFMQEKYRWEYWYKDNNGDEWSSIYATEQDAAKRLRHSGKSIEGIKPRPTFYHTSWNALMPVVEKIIQLPDTNVTANNWLIKIESNISLPISYQASSMDYLKSKNATLIGAYYFVIVEFIKWYNQQPK